MTATQSADWQWFKAHPHRRFRVRPATRGEIAQMRKYGCIKQEQVMAPDCSLYCIARYYLQENKLERIFEVMEDAGELDEGEARAAWFEADSITTATKCGRL